MQPSRSVRTALSPQRLQSANVGVPRLVTLWDLMRPFRAVATLNLLELLHVFRLHENVLRFDDRMAKLERSATAVGYAGGMGGEQSSDEIPDEIRQSGLLAFTDMEANCIALELGTSLATVRKLKTAIILPNSRYGDVYPLAEELRGRLIDEMESKCFWAPTTREREYYEEPRKGWVEIIARFSDSVTDIEEASKCFALSRCAASVFHSVQVVEVGLIELGKLIDVKDPNSGWSAVSSALDQIIAKKHQNRTAFERSNFRFLEQVQGTVGALKNAWRNKISHAEGRLTLMTKDFSPEVAEENLFATRAFMRRLADGLPPKAPMADPS